MGKVGKLTKLRSAMKRLPSLSKLSCSGGSIAASNGMESGLHEKGSEDLQAVYVGKSRRRYYLSSDIICQPLFQELIDRSSSSGGFNDRTGEVVVACEVVLFEHCGCLRVVNLSWDPCRSLLSSILVDCYC